MPLLQTDPTRPNIDQVMHSHYHGPCSKANEETNMSTGIEVDSTLTDRFQTTVPASVRQALKLNRRDRIHYLIRDNGEVVLSRAQTPTDEDPVMKQFLTFLERDLQQHPERIRPVTHNTFAEAKSLTAGIQVNLDDVLAEDEDE